MQGPAIRLAKEGGLETVVVDGDPTAPCASWADRFEAIDLKDKEKIETLARSLRDDGGLAGIMTAGTDFSAVVAWVAERLDLPGIPYEAALDASDKERMRRRFQAAGVPSPDFVILRSVPDGSHNLPFAYPVVVKPVDNMGSRGCRRVDAGEDLASAVADALGYSRSGRAIVEEYMEGPEFSVDAVVHEGVLRVCGLADRHIFFPPYFIEMGHTIPADLDAETLRRLLEVFQQGVRALGITRGAAKGDLKLTRRGPMIGEIAARLSGGYMSGWTYPYASGVEPTRGAIAVAIGRDPGDLRATRDWVCAERAFISIPGGVRGISGQEQARALPFVQDLFFRVAPGSRVRFPENNVTKCGNVIAAAPDRDRAVRAAGEAVRAIAIRLQAPDAETDAFLDAFSFGDPGSVPRFPPDAFSLSAALWAELRALPDPEPVPSGDFALLPFPGFAAGALADYVGRGVAESLDLVRALTGAKLPPAEEAGDAPRLGRRFWAALVRGGYQGAAYLLDRLGAGGR